MITEKSPKQPRHKKYEENTELKFGNLLSKLIYMVKATICLIQSYLL